ncbi:MBL fold metallo-hydrolase [Pseudalkalibacillus caeni]|uniref:MBL fold metallo-hydrolase n=1 Tax=Exobacillus caeni TaxID=2574798 RepID=A0A5R9EXK8_9BACL|nr:MBL fold metallo-hydrolase [Pseudalkalibacillus caeni]TLS34896.1 MBL fold metallo-hydrolase [Pseudalkalibacillus caeni]
MKLLQHEDIIQVKLTVSMAGTHLNVNVFFIDGLLIDTGPARLKNSLIPYFKELPIEQVALTHHHEDHTGLAGWLLHHRKRPLYIHGSGIEYCLQPPVLPFYRKVFWGKRDAFAPEKMPGRIETNSLTFHVEHSPGHAPDHVALIDKENGRLFSGDLYVLPHPKSLFAFESVPEIIRSIKRLLSYDFETLICSHAGVIPKGKEKLAAKLSYLEEIREQVLSLYENGMPANRIRKELFPKIHPLQIMSFFENSSTHLITSILAEYKHPY